MVFYTVEPSEFCQSFKNNLSKNITGRKLESIQENLQRTVYDEKDKQKIVKYASKHGFAAAVRKCKPKFPNLNDRTVRPWDKKSNEN